MKKVICLLLVICMALTAAACTKAQDTQKDGIGQNTQTSQTVSQDDADDDGEVTFLQMPEETAVKE